MQRTTGNLAVCAGCGAVQVVTAHAEALVAAGVPPSVIGIISPYNAQVRHRTGLYVCVCLLCACNSLPQLSSMELYSRRGCAFRGRCCCACPYGADIHMPLCPQVALLRGLRPRPALDQVEIASVDGFQGVPLGATPTGAFNFRRIG